MTRAAGGILMLPYHCDKGSSTQARMHLGTFCNVHGSDALLVPRCHSTQAPTGMLAATQVKGTFARHLAG